MWIQQESPADRTDRTDRTVATLAPLRKTNGEQPAPMPAECRRKTSRVVLRE
jgi:hypothetical protein